MQNENDNNEKEGFVGSVIKDEGVHRAAAGVVVASVVAAAKYFIFR
jgi:hypothetical protein